MLAMDFDCFSGHASIKYFENIEIYVNSIINLLLGAYYQIILD